MNLYERISQLAKSDSLPHAVIFEGSGSKELSKFFAKTAVCESKDFAPCGNCNHCIKADKGVHPDIIELNPVGAQKIYKIGFVRDIKSDTFILPNEAKAKVYIFNEVDNMPEKSQNALLKVLEEPPESVLFVLNCQKKTKLLDTIISRAIVFICENDEDTLTDEAFDIIEKATLNSEFELLKTLHSYSSKKEIFIEKFDELTNALRFLYREKLNGENSKDFEFIDLLTVNRILKAIDITIEAKKSLLSNKAVKLVVVRTCIKLKNTLGR